MGTLKQESVANEMKRHMWIMVIDKNFRDITFMDPLLLKTYVLKDRIKNAGIMEWFLFGKSGKIGVSDIVKKKKPPKNTKSKGILKILI